MTRLVVKRCTTSPFTCQWVTSWLDRLTALVSCRMLVRVVSPATAAAQAPAGPLGRQERQSETEASLHRV